MNIAGLWAANAIDFGLSEPEYTQLMLLIFVPGYMAVYADQRQRPALSFLARASERARLNIRLTQSLRKRVLAGAVSPVIARIRPMSRHKRRVRSRASRLAKMLCGCCAIEARCHARVAAQRGSLHARATYSAS